jgi:hypothetical protein
MDFYNFQQLQQISQDHIAEMHAAARRDALIRLARSSQPSQISRWLSAAKVAVQSLRWQRQQAEARRPLYNGKHITSEMRSV